MSETKKISSRKRNKTKSKIFIYIMLVLISITLLMPLYYLIITSFKTFQESIEEFKWLPAQWNFNNYKEVLAMEEFKFFKFFFNTLYIFGMKTASTVITCSLAAYGFARFKFKYKEVIFMILLSVLMIPGEIVTIPMYEIFIDLGLMDTYVPMYIGGFFATDIFAIFLFRQFFVSVPDSLFEAARIDGCSEFRAFTRIMIPLSKPVIVTLVLLYFSGTYNDIYGPTLYILSDSKYTVAQSIRLIENLYNTGSHTFIVPFNLVASATVIAVIPMFILFFVGQKHFVEGVSTSGIKG